LSRLTIDESGTHGSGVTILGGWVGRLGQWAGFDPKWVKLLKKCGLTFFHSRKMRQTKDQFRGWTRGQKIAFTQAAADLALKHLEFGFTITLRDDAYRDFYVAGNRPREVQLDSAYGLCFRFCLSLVPGLAREAFKRDLDIDFVLESGHKNAGDAKRIFDRVKRQGLSNPEEQAIVKMLNTIAFGEKEKYPGLQAADVNAYSAFQHETASPLELVNLPTGDTMKTAKKMQKVPVFRLELREEELKLFKKFIIDEIEEKKARSKRTGG
jgi:hypothetical protein